MDRFRFVRRALARTQKWRRLNPELGRHLSADHALVAEERPRFELYKEHFADPGERIRVEKYYVRPAAQVGWFQTAGFTHVQIFSQDGSEVTGRVGDGVSESWWLQYMAIRDEVAEEGKEPRASATGSAC